MGGPPPPTLQVVADQTDVVGASEIADMLGVTPERVSDLALRSAFPRPVGRRQRARIWRRTEVEAWARATGRIREDQ
jgi:hypothetical protein